MPPASTSIEDTAHMNDETRSSYTDITNLDGGLFDCRQRRAIPLEAFRMNGDDPPPCVTDAQEPAPVVHHARVDSLSPISMTSTVTGQARRRRAPWAPAARVAAGVASLMVAGALVPSNRAHALERAQAAQIAFTPLSGLEGEETEVSSMARPADDQETETTPASAETAANVEAPFTAPREPIATAPATPRIAAVLGASAGVHAAAAAMPTSAIPPAPAPIEVSINRTRAAIAIAVSALQAGGCKSAGAGAMSVPVSVTFAPSGQVTKATVDGGPLAGTSAGGCVEQALHGASVRPFDGLPATVSTSVYLR
jgi:hypothetical protein